MGFNSNQELDLRSNSYHGVILPDKDPKNQGRYKVHIPELHPLLKENTGIWCKNQNHNWRMGPSEDYMYGSYFPMQPGTKVLIKFYQNDFHSGYIDRVVSDQIQKTNPKLGSGTNPEATSDRDDVYVFFKTPKYHNLFTIFEKTTDGSNGLTQQLIPNSIHLYYNYRRSTMILNEDGIHWFTMNNRGVTVEGNNSEWVNQNEKVYVQENRDIYVNGNEKKYTKGSYDHLSMSTHRETSLDKYDIQSSSHFAVDAPVIFLNSGKSSPAKQAVTNKGEDEIIKQNKVDMRIVAHQKRDDTYYGSDPKVTVGGSPPLPKMEGEKSRSLLEQGQSDRYGSVGQTQVGGSDRPYPPYPNRGQTTKMINLPAISSAVASPTQNMKGLNLSSSSGKFTPSISTLSSATGGIASTTQGAINSSVGGLRSGMTTGLNNTFGILNVTNGASGIANKVGTVMTTTPSYNTLNSLPGGVSSTASSVKSIIGNANSISDLNNRINNSINSNIASTITNPVTSTVSTATYGISSIRNMIETQNVVNGAVNAAGARNIGGRVASEITSLTGSKYVNGIIGYIPGATAAASVVDLVGNNMGLGGILSDMYCNDNFNVDLSLDNPLDRINNSLSNLKNTLQTLLAAFDPTKLNGALSNALGLSALNNALNLLMTTPSCQMVAKSALQRSNAITKSATQSSSTTRTSTSTSTPTSNASTWV